MSVLLLIIGLVLYSTGRIHFAGFQTQGRHARAAGAVLMLPVMSTLLLLNLYLPGAIELGSGMIIRTLFIILMLELSAVCAAVDIARILLFDPPGSLRLPGYLGQLQREARQQRLAFPQAGGFVRLPRPAMIRPRLRRSAYPRVMTLREAARYLRTTEADLLRRIEAGELPAARDHATYKIARSQLDKLR